MRRTCSLLRAAGVAASIGVASSAQSQPVSHDFNADGSSDFPVSITGYNEAEPVTGAARIWSGASKAIIQTVVSDVNNTLFGWSVGSAGDLNADGRDDLIVGEPLWMNADGIVTGRVQVFSGATGSVLLSASGQSPDTALGRYVVGVGDWNDDGTPDIAASGWDVADLDSDGLGDDPIGIVFVLSGADGSVLAEIFDSSATTMFGHSVFGLGDITSDGHADIAVVDRHAQGGNGAEGQVYIFEGQGSIAALAIADAHRVLSNDDPTIRGFATQVDTMHPDLWLTEPTLQIISLTDDNSSGGPNSATSRIEIIETSGVSAGTKGERPSLVLAGDINLDGKVDDQDLQVSISQLGTNPQALGVMPIADLNNDQIVDSADVSLLLDGYGGTTDIYEGLWDGSRLLATVAGNTGFGNISAGTISGSAHVEPGRRPVDDCPPVIVVPPGNTWWGVLPTLLLEDQMTNCNRCPDYGTPAAAGCYECDRPGTLAGGVPSAEPSQPTADQQVRFVIQPVVLSGRTYKCIQSCGGNRSYLEPPSNYPYTWKVFRKVDGAWIEIDNGSASPTPYYSGAACDQLRIEVVMGGGTGECEPSRIERAEDVAFGDFTLKSEMALSWPAPQNREVAGPSESVNVTVSPAAAAAGIQWQYSWPNPSVVDIPGGKAITLPSEVGSYTITATSATCSQTKTFQVIPPSGVEVFTYGYHNMAGVADAGQCLRYRVLPLTVNFHYIEFGEGSAPLVIDPPPHSLDHYFLPPGQDDLPDDGIDQGDHNEGPANIVLSFANQSPGRDYSYKFARPVGAVYVAGSMSWDISLRWRPQGATDWIPMASTLLSTASVDNSGTVTIQKGTSAPVTRTITAAPESCIPPP